jgi:CubicO group peptidase (beta-lactamase class C family)
MKRLFLVLERVSVGRLLWFNLAIAVGLKLLLPLGGSGLATVVSHIGGFDLGSVVVHANQERQAVDVPGVLRDASLDRAAAMKLDDMASSGYFAHVAPDGSEAWDFMLQAGYRYRAAGENLARGFSDPAAMVRAWMRSESHRANLVNPAYQHVGIAGGRAAIDGRESFVVVLMFGRPYIAAAAPTISIPPSTPQPQVAGAVTVLLTTEGPQRISTDKAIAAVPAQMKVSAPVSAATKQVAASLSGWFTTYLIALLGALLIAMGWVGLKRRLVLGWLAHMTLFIIFVSVPAVSHLTSGTIF